MIRILNDLQKCRLPPIHPEYAVGSNSGSNNLERRFSLEAKVVLRTEDISSASPVEIDALTVRSVPSPQSHPVASGKELLLQHLRRGQRGDVVSVFRGSLEGQAEHRSREEEYRLLFVS